MGKFEDLLNRVQELDEDLAEELSEFKGSNLRKKAEQADSLEQELNQLRTKVQELETSPKKESALRDYGVDFDALRPLEKASIKQMPIEGEIDDKWAAKVVEEFGLPVTGTRAQNTETPNAQGVVDHARSAPAGGNVRTTIKPEEASQWPTDKLLNLRKQDPEAFEALKRGEEAVTTAAV